MGQIKENIRGRERKKDKERGQRKVTGNKEEKI